MHGEALKRQIITSNELVDVINEEKPGLNRKVIHDVYIAPLIKQGKLMRIRRGLFLAVPLGFRENESFTFDKFVLAAKTRGEEGIVSYHTALEYYGCAYNNFNEILLGVKTYFHPFNVGNIVVLK